MKIPKGGKGYLQASIQSFEGVVVYIGGTDSVNEFFPGFYVVGS
jgi:hypothetical protein